MRCTLLDMASQALMLALAQKTTMVTMTTLMLLQMSAVVVVANLVAVGTLQQR
jgi:hypothetical protein